MNAVDVTLGSQVHLPPWRSVLVPLALVDVVEVCVDTVVLRPATTGVPIGSTAGRSSECRPICTALGVG